MEAKALEASLEFAEDAGIQEFVLEGDSLIMYRESELSSPPSSVALVDSSMLAFFCRDFCWVEFSHVHRQGNRPE